MSQIKILIVEDEFLIAKGLARKLENLGYQIGAIVASGEEALEILEDLQPHLILMDIAIEGGMDGIEVAAKIHQTHNIPIIFLTAYADDSTLERAEQTGSYGYILKPFKERELHATIKIALKKHQEQLKAQKSLKVAQNLSEERSHYLSIAAHDLRTPLMAIQMSAGMLQFYNERLSEDKKFKHLSRIQASVESMNQLLEDLLVLSRAESGKLVLHSELLEIIGFCRSLVEEVQAIASTQHQLVFHADLDSLIAQLDQHLLRHILLNLLTNAIKYSPQGGTVRLEVTNEGQWVNFQISDSGIGIPPEYQERLFQRFERAENVGNIEGTGLGLSIVKQAIDLQGGEISVESQLERGTTFKVRLPLVCSHPKPAKISENSGS